MQYLRGRIFYISITRHSFYCIQITEGKKDIRIFISVEISNPSFPKVTAAGKHADLPAIQMWTNKQSQHFPQALKTDNSNGIVRYNRQKEKWLSTILQSNDLGKRMFWKQKVSLILHGNAPSLLKINRSCNTQKIFWILQWRVLHAPGGTKVFYTEVLTLSTGVKHKGISSKLHLATGILRAQIIHILHTFFKATLIKNPHQFYFSCIEFNHMMV